MPTPNDDLKERLAHYRPIKISVIGRKSGQTISIPVWFVVEGEKLYACLRAAGPRGKLPLPSGKREYGNIHLGRRLERTASVFQKCVKKTSGHAKHDAERVQMFG